MSAWLVKDLPAFANTPWKELVELAKKAGDFGQKVAKTIYDKNVSPSKNAVQLGVFNIISFEQANENPAQNIRAYYCPNTKTIQLNTRTIDESCETLKHLRLNYFSKKQITDFYVLHELFHHLEETREMRVDVKCGYKGSKNAQAHVRDFGACGFVNEVAGSFCCQILDILEIAFRK